MSSSMETFTFKSKQNNISPFFFFVCMDQNHNTKLYYCEKKMYTIVLKTVMHLSDQIQRKCEILL